MPSGTHHARLALVERIDGLLMFGKGLLLMAIVALSYPTALVGEYLTTPAGEAAVATNGLLVLGTSAAWNIFLLALRPERGLLKPGVPLELIASARRRVALGFVIYVVATGLALVNAYLGLGISTAMWGSGRSRPTGRSTAANDGRPMGQAGGQRRLRRVNADGLVARSSLVGAHASQITRPGSSAAACAGRRVASFPADCRPMNDLISLREAER